MQLSKPFTRVKERFTGSPSNVLAYPERYEGRGAPAKGRETDEMKKKAKRGGRVQRRIEGKGWKRRIEGRATLRAATLHTTWWPV